jgi:membrane associated rhomboid family serine protease
MTDQQYRPGGFRLLPPVVKNLLIINGLFFLATITLEKIYGINLDKILGLYYFGSPNFRPYQLVTYMFLHGDPMHIIYNMFALWMFGYLLENVWGPKRFLTFYMVTGIGAGAVQLFAMWIDFSSIQSAAMAYSQNPSLDGFILFVKKHYPNYYEYQDTIRNFITQWSMSPGDPQNAAQSVEYVRQLIALQMDTVTIGASGAVFGILLAFGMMFPNMYIYIWFFFPIKAKYFVIGYGLIELISGISHNPSDNVAHFAHLGGMLIGFFLILYWRKKKIY